MLTKRFEELDGLDGANAADKRRRGHEFEVLLRDLLDAQGLEPRIRLRPEGEEIDGSFVLRDRTFLLEAKWHAKPMPASAIYAFRGKVEGKLTGTVGVFISMSGFSEEAVDALTYGKLLNVVLFDYDDVAEACSSQPHCGFEDILRAKLRAAAEEGVVLLTREARNIKAAPASPTPPVAPGAERKIAIVCEGSGDGRFIRMLAARIEPLADITVVAAQGKVATAPLANSLGTVMGDNARIIIVVDSDGDLDGTVSTITSRLTGLSSVRVVAVHPELESWTPTGEHLNRVRDSDRLAFSIDLDDLAMRNASFAKFKEAVEWATRGV